MRLSHLVVASLVIVGLALGQEDSSRPVVIRLDPQPARPSFLNQAVPPRAVAAAPHSSVPAAAAVPAAPSVIQPPPPPPVSLQPQPAAASPFGGAPPAPSARQPVFQAAGGDQTFVPAESNPGATPPPPPPVTLPTDVQNQLIKFFGLDSFGIPGLTGNHPNGFAGAVQELRAAGIPVQGLPANHLPGAAETGVGAAPPTDVLAQANPNFANTISQIYNEVNNPAQFGTTGSGQVALPEATPGENGLIGLLSTSIRKLVKETGVADALSQSIPSVLGTGSAAQQDGPVSSARSPSRRAKVSESQDDEPRSASKSEIRRQPSTAQRALSGIAAALGGGGSNSPTHAGLPRIPGIPLLPGGIPRNSQGQIDVVQLIGAITRRVSNGTTLADVLPPEQLQTLADNVTDALLPSTPEKFEMSKLMGRWFEGINSPRATEQRCVVHHYGGLTKNDKTATFTALKIYREGSEFGNVRYSIGYAFRSGNKDSMLQLHSSETSDAQPFWIYKLGPEGKDPFGNPQYEYAIVSNWVKYPVTVLVRDPDTFKAKYEVEVLRWLEDQGFINGFIRAFNLLQPASYSSCQYADSTFEVFGK
ncbi:lpr-3 [Pristionchus pacificus]|nr:lpr-3 [Pristionchus pacificus]